MILICPECNYPVNYHGEDSVDSTTWIRLLSGDKDAECKLSEAKATHAAQRAAAIKHLRMLGMSVKFWANYVRSDTENREWHEQRLCRDIDRVNTAIATLRAVGILKAKKP